MKSDRLSVNISAECWGVGRYIGLGAMYQPASQLSVGQRIVNVLVKCWSRVGREWGDVSTNLSNVH